MLRNVELYLFLRKIKNKAIVNRDPKIAELLMLRKENAELKANIINNGSNVDVTELNSLRQQVETLKSENEALLSQLRLVLALLICWELSFCIIIICCTCYRSDR